MRFHAAFTERELNFKGNSFETSMPAKRGPCLGKTTFVPNTRLGIPLCPLPTLANSSSSASARKDWKERRIPPLHWIFQNQMLSGEEGRRKDPRKRQQRLGKGLERLRGMPSWYNPRERSMNHPTSFPTTGAATPAPNCFSPLFVRGHSGRSRSRSGSHASTFSAMIFLLNFQIFHDSFFLSSFFILDLGKQKFAEGKKIGFKRDRFIPVVRNFAGEFHFPESTSENPQHPRKPRSRRKAKGKRESISVDKGRFDGNSHRYPERISRILSPSLVLG